MTSSPLDPYSLRGKLTLKLHLELGRVASVSIVSTRPQAALLLKGKSPVHAVRLAPLIFSLCGGAQGVAAQAALMAAQGGTPDSLQLADWAGAIRREAAAEHLWRLMMDWPQLLCMDRPEAEYASCRRHCLQAKSDGALAAALQAPLSRLLGMLPAEWLAQDQRAFESWRETSSALGAQVLRRLSGAARESAVPFLPSGAAADWVERVGGIGAGGNGAEFCKQPVWRGEPHETGPLARQHEHPLIAPLLDQGRRIEARMAARLAELAQWACGEFGQPRDWIDAAPCGGQAGLARVETARGVLLHRASVESGAIADYAMVAPTEWNFHPHGAFAAEAGYSTGQGEADAMLWARELALSLDPCVDYEVVLG